ncbi:hypothetical protein HDU93_003630 [Gonapodya sp. JEL0774]|nr:hypothetical protein HDU93_003630 [Gonapodya sp. JEL0774]
MLAGWRAVVPDACGDGGVVVVNRGKTTDPVVWKTSMVKRAMAAGTTIEYVGVEFADVDVEELETLVLPEDEKENVKLPGKLRHLGDYEPPGFVSERREAEKSIVGRKLVFK